MAMKFRSFFIKKKFVCQINLQAGRHCKLHQMALGCKISLQGFKCFINFITLSLIWKARATGQGQAQFWDFVQFLRACQIWKRKAAKKTNSLHGLSCGHVGRDPRDK